MSHGVMMSKWENMNMASAQVPPAYKMDRPAYSTPPPVENTPANNECHLVDLRGAKVASFQIGNEQYICLPQAFDLFLKHLVGGLHTVYTKLKRLSIQPVVCNVEQVRVLRGRGAIQPGVNRCKLITKKDFEILYQDCTTASRPGRPPKRYPMLPPTELVNHHQQMTSRRPSVTNPLLHQSEIFQQHKRIRLDSSPHVSSTPQDHSRDRRGSGSPCKEEFKDSMQQNATNHNNNSELPNNPATFAYIQALSRYQQMHNNGGMGMGAAAGAAAAAGQLTQQINPFMVHQLLSPHQQITMLNHFNQFQTQLANGTLAALAANGQHNPLSSAQSLLQRHHEAASKQQQQQQRNNSSSSPGNVGGGGPSDGKGGGNESGSNDKESDEGVVAQDSPDHDIFSGGNAAGNSARDLRVSVSLLNDSASSHYDNNDVASSNNDNSNGGGGGEQRSRAASYELSGDAVNVQRQQQRRKSFGSHVTAGNNTASGDKNEETSNSLSNNMVLMMSKTDAEFPMHEMDKAILAGGGGGVVGLEGALSVEKLLNKVQELLKIAASTACSQEKSYSVQIADLKQQLDEERQLRERSEKRWEQKVMEKEKSLMEVKEECREHKENSLSLETQVIGLKRMLGSYAFNLTQHQHRLQHHHQQQQQHEKINHQDDVVTVPSASPQNNNVINSGGSPRSSPHSPLEGGSGNGAGIKIETAAAAGAASPKSIGSPSSIGGKPGCERPPMASCEPMLTMMSGTAFGGATSGGGGASPPKINAMLAAHIAHQLATNADNSPPNSVNSPPATANSPTNGSNSHHLQISNANNSNNNHESVGAGMAPFNGTGSSNMAPSFNGASNGTLAPFNGANAANVDGDEDAATFQTPRTTFSQEPLPVNCCEVL